ncbi:hypothetical protein [Pseudolysinimonas sp.]
MGRKIPWLVVLTAIPAAVLIVAGFLGATPVGVVTFVDGIALLAIADLAERRLRAR